MAINRTKFDVCTFSSFGGLKTQIRHRRTFVPIFTNLSLTWVIMASLTQQDNHPGEVINRSKYGVCRPSSFQSVDKNKEKKKKILALLH